MVLMWLALILYIKVILWSNNIHMSVCMCLATWTNFFCGSLKWEHLPNLHPFLMIHLDSRPVWIDLYVCTYRSAYLFIHPRRILGFMGKIRAKDFPIMSQLRCCGQLLGRSPFTGPQGMRVGKSPASFLGSTFPLRWVYPVITGDCCMKRWRLNSV